MLAPVFLSLLLWEMGSSFTVSNCPDNLPRDEYLTVFNDKCYYFYTNVRKEYEDARFTCKENGGNLANVKTSGINNYIWRNLKYKYNFDGIIWIGLNDRDNEGDYVWSDGSMMVYDNFDINAGTKTPWYDISNKYQDCVAMEAINGKWLDMKCTDTSAIIVTIGNHHESFVCEYYPEYKDGCPPSLPRGTGLRLFEDKCYYFHSDAKLTFSLAKYACRALGGDLVSIKTQKVQDIVWETLRAISNADSSSKGPAWIGLSDEVFEGAFVWVKDNTLAHYKHFGATAGLGIRRNDSSDCVAMSDNSGYWFDYSCDDHKIFICEFPSTISRKTTVSPPSIATMSTTHPATTYISITNTTTTTMTTTTTVTSNATIIPNTTIISIGNSTD